MHSTRLKPSRCPRCHYEMDAASSMDKDSKHTPSPGDFSVCIKCGMLLRFNDDMSLRQLTADDTRELPPEAMKIAFAVNLMRTGFPLMREGKC